MCRFLYLYLYAAILFIKTKNSNSSSSEYCYGFSDYITESCACNKEFVNHPSTDEDGRVVPKGVIEECKPCYKSIGSSISFTCELCPANSSSLQGDRICICNPGFAQSSSNEDPVCTWLRDQTEYTNSNVSSFSNSGNSLTLTFHTSAISDDGKRVYGIPISTTGKLFHSDDYGKSFTEMNLADIDAGLSSSSNMMTMSVSGDGLKLFIGGMPGPLAAYCFDSSYQLCTYGIIPLDESVQSGSYYYTSITVNHDASVVLAIEMRKDVNTNELYVQAIRQSTNRNFQVFHSLSTAWMHPQHFSLTSLLMAAGATVGVQISSLFQLTATGSYPNITRTVSDYLYSNVTVKTSHSGQIVVYTKHNADSAYVSYSYGNGVSNIGSVPCTSTSLDMSFSGKYIYCISSGNQLYRSEDFGVSFHTTHEQFQQVAVDHGGQVVLGLDVLYNLVESYDFGKTFTMLTGGVTSFALAKASYDPTAINHEINPDHLYITATKHGVRYNRLKPNLYKPCDVGYHSSTGYGPTCVACPVSSTNLFMGQTECNTCRNGYFGINGEAPCHEYYGWMAYAIISIYTATVIIAAFLYSNKKTIQKKYTELKQMSKDIQERWASATEEKSKGNAGDIEHTEHGNKVGEESKIVDSQEDGEDEEG